MIKHKGRKNVYNCRLCHESIVTIDLHKGTTPFKMRCKKTKDCTGYMESMFYLVDQDLEAEFEWYKPNREEYKKLQHYFKQPVRRGELLIRKKS